MIDKMSKDPFNTDKRNTVLPHEWRIREASKKLHKFCDIVVPMKHEVTINGECVDFVDIVDITINFFHAFGLSETAKIRAIDMALTLDGAQLTNKLSFVMAGMKLVDTAVQNPITG